MKINGKIIPKYSELTTAQFCEVANSKVSSIPEYVSLFTKMSIEKLMDADFKTPSKTYLLASIFDVDISKTMTTKKEVIEFRGETILTKNIRLKTFGKAYLFDIYHQKHREEKINHYELFVYALSIALSNHPSLADVDEIKKELDRENWIKVMPHAFFFAKQFLKRRSFFQVPLILYILDFKEINMRIRYSLRKLRKLETM